MEPLGESHYIDTLYYRTCNNFHVREEDIDKEYQARCGISIKGNCVIVTELPDNPGMSVTNAAEYVADEICERYGIRPEELILIEHYPQEPNHEETFALVNFQALPDVPPGSLRFRPIGGRRKHQV